MIFDYTKDTGFSVNNIFKKSDITPDYDVQEFEKFRQMMKDTGDSAEVVAETMKGKVNPSILAYAQTTDAAHMSVSGLDKYIKTTNQSFGIMAVKSKAAAIGVGALNVVTGLAVSALAGLAVTGVIKLFDHLIETPKEIAEAAQVAIDKIDELTSSLSSNQQIVNESGQRFAELAQGVNTFTGENLSLSDTEYEEFLGISNQLAEVFPELDRNYNSNGDAIVQLSGSVNTIVDSLDELIARQRELTNMQIADSMPELFAGAKNNIQQIKDTIEKTKDEITKLEEEQKKVKESFFPNYNIPLTDDGQFIEKVFKTGDSSSYLRLEGELQNLGVDYSKQTMTMPNDPVNSYIAYDFTLTDEQYDKIISDARNQYENLGYDYTEQINRLREKLETEASKIDTEYSSLQSSIVAWLSGDSNYQSMTPKMQNVMQGIIDNFDWDGLNFSSWESAASYINQNYLSVFATGIDTSSIEDLFSKSIDELPVNEFIQKITEVEDIIQKQLDAKGIAINFNLDFLSAQQEDILERVQNKLWLMPQGETVINDFVNGLNAEDLAIILELDVDGTTGREELKRLIEDYKKIANTGEIIDLSPIHEQLDKIQSAYQTVAGAIHEYDTTQMLSLDTIQSLLQLEDKYLAVLYDENGQLQLNTETYDNLTRAKLLQMQVDMVSNAISTINSLNNEVAAKNYLKDTTLDLTGAKWEDVTVTLELARAELLEAQARGETVDSRLQALNQIEASIKAKQQLFEETEKSLGKNSNNFYGYTPTKTKQKNEFDWIANSVENASNAVDILNDKLANATLNEKIPIFEELKEANQNLVDVTGEAVEAYEDEWTKASSKISPEYRNQIMSSDTFEVETFKNDKNYENIKASKEAYDAWKSSEKTHADALKKQEQTEKDIIANNREINQIKLDTLSYVNQDNMTALEKNRLLREERVLLYSILQDNLALANSAEEKIKLEDEYQQKLDENAKKQRENNNQERDNKISFYESRVKDIQNEIDLEEAKGGQGTEAQYLAMNQALDDEIKHYNLAYDEAFDARNEADWGTDAWDEANAQMQEAQDNINACTIAQIENNRAILMLPVKKFEDANKELEKQLDLQNKHLEKLESALGYAQLLVQDEIDALNEEKELISESYEDRIKAIQEEKDALTESNDERQREIDLENAKYNLDKAMRNRTQRIYKAGQGFVYEADPEAIRDAQADLDQQEFDNTIANLDKQINTLNEDKEDELEVIADEIKTWEDYAKKLNDVSDSYDRLISRRNFLEMFGTSGEANILQQDTGIIASLGTALNNAKGEVDNIQEKIDANNLTITKIKEEAEGYLGTTKQIKEAQEAINKAIVENEAEIKAIEARSEKTNEFGGAWTAADTEVEEALDLIDTAQTEGKEFEGTVLGERKLALEQFRDAAVLLYKEIAREVSKANLAFSTLETTLTNAQKTYKEILALADSASDIEITVTSTIPEMHTFHSGGIVGKQPKNDLPENLMALTDTNLKPNETLAKLLNGEVVLNNTQMGNMFNNLNRAYSALTPLNKRESSPVEITIGDVNVYNPENTDMIVNEIVRELPLKVVQRLHSK